MPPQSPHLLPIPPTTTPPRQKVIHHNNNNTNNISSSTSPFPGGCLIHSSNLKSNPVRRLFFNNQCNHHNINNNHHKRKNKRCGIFSVNTFLLSFFYFSHFISFFGFAKRKTLFFCDIFEFLKKGHQLPSPVRTTSSITTVDLTR